MKQKEIRGILSIAVEAICYAVNGTKLDCKTRRRLSECSVFFQGMLQKGGML